MLHLPLPLGHPNTLGSPGDLGRAPCSPVTVGALPGAAPARLVLGIQQDLLHVPVVDGQRGWHLLLAPRRHGAATATATAIAAEVQLHPGPCRAESRAQPQRLRALLQSPE